MTLLMSTCVYAAVESIDGRVGVTRNPSCQGRDLMDHPGLCNSRWGESEEYRGRTYPPCVPQSQVNSACVHILVSKWVLPISCLSAWKWTTCVCLLGSEFHIVQRWHGGLSGSGSGYEQRGWARQWDDSSHSRLPHLTANTVWSVKYALTFIATRFLSEDCVTIVPSRCAVSLQWRTCQSWLTSGKFHLPACNRTEASAQAMVGSDLIRFENLLVFFVKTKLSMELNPQCLQTSFWIWYTRF